MSLDLPAAVMNVSSDQAIFAPSAKVHACIGVCSKGPLTPINVGSLDALKSTFGFGMGVKAAAYELGKTGAPVVMCRRAPTAVAAVIGTPDLTDWDGANAPALTGTPNDHYLVVFEVVAPGELNTATGRYSLDGGVTYSTTATIPTSGIVVLGGSGITATFTAGTGNDVEGSFTVELFPASQSVSPVTTTRVATSTGVVTVSGTPLDAYEGKLLIVAGGDLGVDGITYRVSLDGGRTYTKTLRLGTDTSIQILDGTEDSGLDLDLDTVAGLLDGLTVIGEIDSGSPTTCTFSAPANKAAVLSQLNAAFDGSPFTAPGNALIATSPTTGLDSEVGFTGGTALTLLGLAIATVNGTGTSATVTGTGDLSVGGLYGGGGTLDGLTVIGAIDNGTPTTCTFSAPANKAAVLTQLNAAFDGSPFTAPGNFLIITSPTTGLASEIDITGGTGLTALGLSVADTFGTGTSAAVTGTADLSNKRLYVNGIFDAGDYFTFTTTEPVVQTSDVLTALDALDESQLDWRFAHVVGAYSRTDVSTMGGEVFSWAGDQLGNARFTWGLFSARSKRRVEDEVVWANALAEDFDTLENTRVVVSGGYARITCPITKRRNRRPASWVAVPEIVRRPIEESIARKATGALSSDVQIYEDDVRVEHDARLDPTLQGARFLTLRTYKKEPGVYVTRDSTFDEEGGLEGLIARRSVLDVATEIFRQVLEDLTMDGVEVNLPDEPNPGAITEESAARIDTETARRIRAVLQGKFSGLTIRTDRTTVLAPGSRLVAKVSMIGLEYIDGSEGTIGFVSAAVAAIAA
jgi:hypothetical protein